MSRWFRHYAGMMRDDKLVRVAIQSKQPVERVLWVFGAILESAAEINDGGRFDFNTAEAAYFLRADEGDIRAVVDGLTAVQRVAGDRLVNWSARQFESDRSATRQAAYRERKREEVRNADNQEEKSDGEVTALSRHADAPETETELKTKKNSKRPANEDFREFWRSYPKRKGGDSRHSAEKLFLVAVNDGVDPKQIVAAIKAGIGFDQENIGTKFIPQAVKWLRDRRWEEYLDGSEADADRRAKNAEFMKAKGWTWNGEKWVPPPEAKVSGEQQGRVA